MGGFNTVINEYPMMAGLIYNRVISVFCGAVIVSNSHVVTAAHCMSGKTIANISILVGDYDYTTGADTRFAALYPAAYVIINSGYNGGDNNDIAVLKSAQAFQFNAAVGPVCLPYGNDQFVGQYVDMVGWGTTSYSGPISTAQRKVEVQVISNAQCMQVYRNRIQPSNICTYSPGRDACQVSSPSTNRSDT